MLFLISILHQTATSTLVSISASVLFLISILHQTATVNYERANSRSCSLSVFYIKPQRMRFI